MIDKRCADMAIALADVKDGAVVLVSGFGDAGSPTDLLHGLRDQGAKDLTIVSNNAGSGRIGIAALLDSGQVRKVVCSYPRTAGSFVFDELYNAGKLELELVPQGTLAERIRAAGAGVGAFYTPTGAGTQLAEGKETREIDGRLQVLEYPIKADLALVKAERADRWGNLTYRKAARNFGPLMCMAAATTVVQVREVSELGSVDPEQVITPSIFVDRLVEIPDLADERELIAREKARS